MQGSRTSECSDSVETERIQFHGIPERKKYTDDYTTGIPNCRANGIKHFGQGYYVETVGNITDEAVQKYIKEQAEESRKED